MTFFAIFTKKYQDTSPVSSSKTAIEVKNLEAKPH
jgi:hypothetical protein